MPAIDKFLPTSVIGSYATPGWLWTALEEIKAGRYGQTDERETFDDAVNIAIRDQERAGVDIITDGEMRRYLFVQNFYARVEGLQSQPPLRQTGFYAYDSVPRYLLTGPITIPQGLGVADEFRYLRANTERAVKATCPGPLTLTIHIRLRDSSVYESRTELAMEFARAINAELKDLVAMGAAYVQIDEPSAAIVEGSIDEWVELLNVAFDGVDARRCLHVCFGNLLSRPRGKRQYGRLFPALGNVTAEEFSFEFANREMTELEVLKEVGPDRDLSVGLVDVKSFWIEPPQEIAQRVKQVAEHVSPERITVTPDCGFFPVPRWLAFEKLKNMVAGVDIARRELVG